jgi:hypothetical protein
VAETGLKGSRRSSPRSAAARPGSEIFQTACGLMAGGARTVLVTRWRTGGRTNFDLVREFVQELPNSPAADAWQRACVLAREAPLDITHEPRVTRPDESAETPTADHPFFWAGYLLVDSTPRRTDNESGIPDELKVEPAPMADAEQRASEAENKPETPAAASAAPPPDPTSQSSN